MMRAFLFAIALIALPGCGSSSAEPTTADTGGADPFATSGASGVFGDRNAACARVASALNSRGAAIGCALSAAKCPDMIDDLEQRAGVSGQCMEYDLGTVANCEARIAAYAACTDFAAKPCQLGLRQSLTNNCATSDAGSDAPSEGG
jgi:hypothetical protein